MTDYIIGTDAFRKNLDDWLFKNNQANADFLFLNRNKIPPTFRSYTKKLYRGMSITEDDLEKLENSGFMTLNKHTSWTKDEKIAINFIQDESFSLSRVNNSKRKVLITKIIPAASQILDIDSFVLFMGIPQLLILGYDETSLDSASKEKEVLISKGLRVSKNNVKILS